MRFSVFVLAFAILAGTTAYADEIPAYTALTCEKNCPVIVRAKLQAPVAPQYPSSEIRNNAESIVDICYTVGTDGRAKNAIVEQVTGSKGFSDASIAALEQEQYQPATEDGKPVEENRRKRYIFRFEGSAQPGARPGVFNAYNDAMADAKSKPDEAIATLRGIFDRSELNLYESAMVSLALAQLEVNKNDYDAALIDIRNATLLQGYRLDNPAREKALRLRIELEAHAGDFAEAFAWFEILKKQPGASIGPDDREAQLVVQLHNAIASPKPLGDDAKIASNSENPHWQHTLLRRSFTFAGIQGKLEKFDLRCDHHGIESPVSDKAEWAVPATWGGCLIYVYGAPGSSFQFVEFQPKDAVKEQGSHS